jgi:hypothetical protein
MPDHPRKQPPPDWIFKGFLIGLVLGTTIGCFVEARDHWSKYPSLAVPFWALVCALTGLLLGVAHRLFVRR